MSAGFWFGFEIGIFAMGFVFAFATDEIVSPRTHTIARHVFPLLLIFGTVMSVIALAER